MTQFVVRGGVFPVAAAAGEHVIVVVCVIGDVVVIVSVLSRDCSARNKYINNFHFNLLHDNRYFFYNCPCNIIIIAMIRLLNPTNILTPVSISE